MICLLPACFMKSLNKRGKACRALEDQRQITLGVVNQVNKLIRNKLNFFCLMRLRKKPKREVLN